MLWNALLKETLMIRKSQICTLSAVAFAIMLPIAAFVAQGTTTTTSKS